MLRTAGLAAHLVCVLLVAAAPGCKKSKHARVVSYTPPAVPAGFAEQQGPGFRVAVPATWKQSPQRPPAAWAVADPQTVDEYHANANVVTEPFTGDSYDFAKANEAGLREQKQATVESAREDVIDGDPTLIFESRWAPTPPSSVSLRTMQAALASHGTGYVVTCAVAASAFERYRSTCESIVRSFAVQR